jgi:coiled-coil domain-containing protein 64
MTKFMTFYVGKLSIREAELKALKEELDIAKQDLMETHLGKDAIVKKAWDVRDHAVQRKNKAEIEVARTRIDMMQVNSLLMEAVQQKIQLSEQLEQWQVSISFHLCQLKSARQQFAI